VIKIDKSDRRIGLSIKAANYSQEQLKAEQAALDASSPAKTWSHSSTPSTLRTRPSRTIPKSKIFQSTTGGPEQGPLFFTKRQGLLYPLRDEHPERT
jgi:hypothetical protein